MFYDKIGRRSVLLGLVTAGLLCSADVFAPPAARAGEEIKLDTSWVASPAQARELIAAGAVVFDARDPSLQAKLPLQGAANVQWPMFSKASGPPEMGLLADDDVLTKKFQELGVSSDKPVVVVGDTLNGWGEDGRIVWTLRSRGHKGAVIVDGGYQALVADGMPAITAAAVPGNWMAVYDGSLEATLSEVKESLGKPNVVFLDTREPREFNGGTPYGESRAGHLPGAKHIYYKDFFDADGLLLKADEIKAKLASQGVTDDSEVIAYCTGGVRSGYFTAVLQTIGINKTQNYSGSMWEWASQPEADYPLSNE